MIIPTYLTLPEAVQILSKETALPVTIDWLLQHVIDEKLQMFFHPQQVVVTGNFDDADSLKYYEPGQKYSLDKTWAKLMIVRHSIDVTTLPDAKGKPSFVTDLKTEKRTGISLFEKDLYVSSTQLEELSKIRNCPEKFTLLWLIEQFKNDETLEELAHDVLTELYTQQPSLTERLYTTNNPPVAMVKYWLESAILPCYNIKGTAIDYVLSDTSNQDEKIFIQRTELANCIERAGGIIPIFLSSGANFTSSPSEYSLSKRKDSRPNVSSKEIEFLPNESLLTTIEPYLDLPYCDLPELLRRHVDVAFYPCPNYWDTFTRQERVKQIDSYDLQHNPVRALEHAAGWWDATMDASAWWSVQSVKPLHAAMLLARYNPNKESEADAETHSNDEMEPHDFRRLKNSFEGALDKAKTLKAWVAYARDQHLKIHSWIVEWEAWIKQASMNEENISKPPKHATPPPSFYRPQKISADSGYTEEAILGLGLDEKLSFLVFVPSVGACRVPTEALEHFLADTDLNEYDAGSLAEYWSHEKSQPWKIKRNALWVLAESWEQYAKTCDENGLIVAEILPHSDESNTIQKIEANETGLKRREKQIRAIISEITKANVDPLKVPTGKKKYFGEICQKSHPDLFGSFGQFKEAWKEASKNKRVRTANYPMYIAR